MVIFDEELFNHRKYIVCCKTKEASDEFLSGLAALGYIWQSGDRLDEFYHYDNYGSNTCYLGSFSYKIAYCNSEDAEHRTIYIYGEEIQFSQVDISQNELYDILNINEVKKVC